jgi:hypothetical protein
MQYFLIAFAAIAILTLPGVVAGAPLEEMETEISSAGRVRRSFGTWLHERVGHLTRGNGLSQQAEISSLPQGIHHV